MAGFSVPSDRSGAVLGPVAQRLVVGLKEDTRFPGQRVVPAARIPFPAHVRVVQPIADRGKIVALMRIDIVDRLEELVPRGARTRMGHSCGVRGIDDVPAIDGQIAVVELLGRRVEPRGEMLGRLGQRLIPGRGGGGDQKKMVQHRPAKGRMEEMVAERVLLGQQSFRQIRRVAIAQHKAAVVAPAHEFVHAAGARLQQTIVDLHLFLIEAMDQVFGRAVGRHIRREVIGPCRQTGRDVRVGGRAGQGHQRLSPLVNLSRRGRRAVQALGAGKLAIQAVEAPVLLVDHDPVVDLAKSTAGACFATGALAGAGRRFTALYARAGRSSGQNGNEETSNNPMHGQSSG